VIGFESLCVVRDGARLCKKIYRISTSILVLLPFSPFYASAVILVLSPPQRADHLDL
jgi:hypothetical protein